MKTNSSFLMPIKIALFVAFGLIALVVGMKALNGSADNRSRAADPPCPSGRWKDDTHFETNKVKNQKGNWVDKKVKVTGRKCVPLTLQELGAGGQIPKSTISPTKPPIQLVKPKCSRLCSNNNCGPWSCPPGTTPPVETLQVQTGQ